MNVSSNLRKALAFGAFASVLLSTTSAFSACYTGRAAISPQTVAEFKANPAALLQQAGPNDNGRVISRIRDLAASDPSTLPTIMNMLGGASPAQQTAIGAGLGQAAAICTRNDPEFARAIQQAVASSNTPAAATAFAGASGDSSTAAGGPGGGGSGGGGGVGGSTAVGSGAPSGGSGGGGTTGAGSPGNGTSSPTVSSGGNTGASTAALSSQSASP